MTTDRRASVASPAVAAEAYRRGLAQYRQGRRADALADLRLAVATAPDNADYVYDLGVILLEGEAHAEAAECFASAARLQPTAADALVNLSKCQLALDRAEEAERVARRAADLAPGAAATHHNLGLALRRLNRHAEAAAALRRAVELDPGSPPLWNDLGNALQELEAFAESERHLRRASELDPNYLPARSNLGGLLYARERLDEAERVLRKLVEEAPDFAHGYTNLALVLAARHRPREAITVARQGLDRTRDPKLATTLGLSYFNAGAFAEALRLLREAMVAQPDHAEARYYLALTSLALGSYEEGWLHYGGRPHAQAEAFAWNRTRERRPRPALEGISVSVHGEQGLGDELFFMRFLAPLARVARRVSYRGDPRLRVLLERAGIGCVWGDETDDPPDLECLAGDLPFMLGHPVSVGFPPPFPVSALPERAAALRQRLAAFGPPPYLGVTWRAGFAESAQRADLLRVLFKRIEPKVLGETLARFPGSLVSVQRRPQPGELEAFQAGAGRPVLDLSGTNEDLDEIIGVLVLLDDYVGVSNTNMYLRAGLGRTARVLAPMPPEWRWAAAGASSPWFPGFAVYREAADTGWTPVLRTLSEDLARSGDER